MEQFQEQEEIEASDMKKKVYAIEDLPGLGPATIAKLSASGFNDMMSLAVATPGELVGATEMSESTAKKVIAIARANLDICFTSGDEVMRKREACIKFTSGSKELDKLMGGGFETGALTECYGQYGSGKSQLAHTLAVTCQLPPEKGGAAGMAVFIDTEGTFRPERIVSIAKHYDLDGETALKNIKVARAYNSDHQMLIAEKVEDLVKVQGLPIRVVIVDSLVAHFRAEYVGRGTLADRQQKLNKHMHTLAKMCDKYNICVYVTNQVMSKPDQFFGDPTEAVGGHIVGHNSTYRFYLRRGKKGSRVAKMVDAPCLPEGEAIFALTEQGVVDV